MAATLTQQPVARRRNDRKEPPLSINAEQAMNAVAILDDAIRCAVRAKIALVECIAKNNRGRAA